MASLYIVELWPAGERVEDMIVAKTPREAIELYGDRIYPTGVDLSSDCWRVCDEGGRWLAGPGKPPKSHFLSKRMCEMNAKQIHIATQAAHQTAAYHYAVAALTASQTCPPGTVVTIVYSSYAQGWRGQRLTSRCGNAQADHAVSTLYRLGREARCMPDVVAAVARVEVTS